MRYEISCTIFLCFNGSQCGGPISPLPEVSKDDRANKLEYPFWVICQMINGSRPSNTPDWFWKKPLWLWPVILWWPDQSHCRKEHSRASLHLASKALQNRSFADRWPLQWEGELLVCSSGYPNGEHPGGQLCPFERVSGKRPGITMRLLQMVCLIRPFLTLSSVT